MDTRQSIKDIYIIGMGPGDARLFSDEAASAIACCDAFAGAKRVMEMIPDMGDKPCLVSYKPDEIMRFIDDQKAGCSIGLLYSGDIGFYSGAKGIIARLNEAGDGYRLHIIPGLSSLTYFMDILGKSWDDAVFTSKHGKTGNDTMSVSSYGIISDDTMPVSSKGDNANIIALIRDNKKVCTLLGNGADVADICKRLVYYGMSDVKVTVGERLSYDDERISEADAGQMCDRSFDALAVAIFENEHPKKKRVTAGIDDACFIRDRVPMTKCEVRTIAISKLGLLHDSIIYDVGAGTGSVSVELALLVDSGNVYSIEMKDEAIELLNRNRQKFIADNMHIIHGRAPEVLCNLPSPTHAFIGGSAGSLKEIIRAIRDKNPNTRCVITAVTMETICEINALLDMYPEYEESLEMITVNVSRTRPLAGYHMLQAENPVYIVAFGGKKVAYEHE